MDAIKYIHTATAALLAVMLLSACSSGFSPDITTAPTDRNVSMVYGYIDMSDAPSAINQVVMQQIRPRIEESLYHFRVVDGMFYNVNIPRATFKFYKFAGHNKRQKVDFSYRFPTRGRSKLDLVIRRPGMYYVGSWKFRKIKGKGLMSRNAFGLVPIKSPGEKELLQRMLPYAKHPHWKRMIRGRLAGLR